MEYLAEEGWPRAPLRATWERQVLADAINAHLWTADASAQRMFDELRRAIGEWVASYRDRAAFTQGWSVRKFSEWLASARPAGAVRRPDEQAPATGAVTVYVATDDDDGEPPTPPTEDELALLDRIVAEQTAAHVSGPAPAQPVRIAIARPTLPKTSGFAERRAKALQTLRDRSTVWESDDERRAFARNFGIDLEREVAS